MRPEIVPVPVSVPIQPEFGVDSTVLGLIDPCFRVAVPGVGGLSGLLGVAAVARRRRRP